jgi:hypothetical protein
VLVFIVGMIALFWWAVRWRKRRKAAKRAQREAESAAREAYRMSTLRYPPTR